MRAVRIYGTFQPTAGLSLSLSSHPGARIVLRNFEANLATSGSTAAAAWVG